MSLKKYLKKKKLVHVSEHVFRALPAQDLQG